jgi:hemerythrin-like domain-containing protein
MKITDRLVADHKSFRKLMADLDVLVDAKTDPPPSRLIRLVELLKDHIFLHAWAEDVFYYPLIRAKLPSDERVVTTVYMDHLDHEHKTVDGALDRLEADVKDPASRRFWRQSYALFASGLNAHMKKEENELFPFSERLLGAQGLEAASQELERRRKEAPAIRLHHQESTDKPHE